MKNSKEYMQKMNLAMDLIKIIDRMAQQGEDYSLIQRNYNELIKEYKLLLVRIAWISNTEFEFTGDYINSWED